MRGTELLDKMELVEPAYVEAADARTGKRRKIWLRWGAAAACLCLAAVGALTVRLRSVPESPEFANLEPLTIPELRTGGMGFESYLWYDIAESDNGNPWSEKMKITSLPVYKNKAYDPSGGGFPVGLSEEELRERLDFAASALDLQVLSTKLTVVTDVNYIQAETNRGIITVEADGSIEYRAPESKPGPLSEGLELPEEYNFTDNCTEAEAKSVLAYLADTYRDFLAFEKPEYITWGKYTFSGDFQRRFQVYDASGDDVEDILNYNFHRAEFINSLYGGTLCCIRIRDDLLLAEKIGDYPIITVKEATKRLTSGNYQTSAPYAFPGKKYIGKVELIYRSSPHAEMLLPYYRFYVLLPESEKEHTDMDPDLQYYGAYYVPAIADPYIANMPVYDGRFN